MLLHDCPHTVLKDLIQFMYCGEVNVAPDDLPAFLKVAEGLQIKGLMENADSTTTAEIQVPSSVTNDGGMDPTGILSVEMNNSTNTSVSNDVPTRLGTSTVVKRTRKRVSEPSGAARTTENNRRSKRQKIRVEVPPSEPEDGDESNEESEESETNDEESEEEEENEDNVNGEEYIDDEYNGQIDEMLDGSALIEPYIEADTSVNGTRKTRRSKNSQHSVEFLAGKTNRIMLVDKHKFYRTKPGKTSVVWHCRLAQTLGCPARVKTNLNDRVLEYLDLNHNHGVATCTMKSKALNTSVQVKDEPE